HQGRARRRHPQRLGQHHRPRHRRKNPPRRHEPPAPEYDQGNVQATRREKSRSRRKHADEVTRQHTPHSRNLCPTPPTTLSISASTIADDVSGCAAYLKS